MQVIANCLVRLLIGMHEIAGQLRPPAMQILVRHWIKRIGPHAGQLHILARRVIG